MRLFLERKGNKRPEIIALDWNPKPSVCEENIDQMIAIATPPHRTRVFGRFEYMAANYEWRMMVCTIVNAARLIPVFKIAG